MVNEVLSEWRQFLYVINLETENGTVVRQYRLYHASFLDFIRENKRHVIGEEIDVDQTRAEIAEMLLIEKGLERYLDDPEQNTE